MKLLRLNSCFLLSVLVLLCGLMSVAHGQVSVSPAYIIQRVTLDSLRGTNARWDTVWFSRTNRDVSLYRSAANILYTPDTLSVAGRVYLANGTAAAPSLAGVNDPNTGLNWATNDTLVITTGGTDRWRIMPAGILQSNGAQTIQTSSGNLTLNPTANVTVSNDLTVTDQLIVSGTGPHAIGKNATSNRAFEVKTRATTSGGFACLQSFIGTVTSDGNNNTISGVLVLPDSFSVGATTGNIGYLLQVAGADVLKAGSGNLATAVGVYVTTPTIATTNYAILVDAGAVRMDDSLSVGTGAKPTLPLDVGGAGKFTGSLIIGGGTAIAKSLSATRSIDFPSVAAQTSVDSTITVTGAAVGDVVNLGVPNAAAAANSCYTGWVSATDVVTVRFNNYSAGAIDPAAGTFRAQVIAH